VGVFGSVDVAHYVLRVTGEVDHEAEGRYRISGRAGDEELDFTMEPFIYDLDQGGFSAFVDGAVSQGAVNQSGDGVVNQKTGSLQFSFDVFRTGPPRFHRHSITGFRTTDRTPFPVTYAVTDEDGSFVVTATLTARQVSGPAAPAGAP
jgi:hypothetical protein